MLNPYIILVKLTDWGNQGLHCIFLLLLHSCIPPINNIHFRYLNSDFNVF